jgi:soluble lytic murein transglycosylase-like protein
LRDQLRPGRTGKSRGNPETALAGPEVVASIAPAAAPSALIAAPEALDSDAVDQRLQVTFALVPEAETVAAHVRVPKPRPESHGEVEALAYAEEAPRPRLRLTQGQSAIAALVEKHAEENDIPPALALALVKVESNYNPKATGARGEIGLLQINPKTARAMGYKGSSKALYDPETNLQVGLKYLARAHDLADGDTCGTLLRYNAGLDAKRMNSATSRFCSKVKSVMRKRA